jgi:cytochrome b involved in lipid metabolism
VVEGKVLDVTGFLADHPGGEQAILLYAGKDATEEFNMIHDGSVLKKHGASLVVGTLKQ